MNTHMNWSGETLALFAAAHDAMRQIPPAFPLDATVAVNPWLGQVQEDRTIAAARLARVGGGRMFLPRETVAAMIDAGEIATEDMAAAAEAYGFAPDALAKAARARAAPQAAMPTLADLAQKDSGVDWPALVEDRIGHWAAAHFDRGQAFWPAPEGSAWTSWKIYASRDLTPDLAGLSGFSAQVAATPTGARAAFDEACRALGLTADDAPLYFHRLLVTLSGWAQHARHLHWLAERDGGHDDTLFDLLTVRLMWDVALLKAGGTERETAWQAARDAYVQPVGVDTETRIDAALQDAADRAAEQRLTGTLSANPSEDATDRPAIQAAFCIDVRSERLRRALETVDPNLQTIGFAGFFGLPLAHRGHASDIVEARSPILLSPPLTTKTQGEDLAERATLRTIRAWGRFKRAAVSAFAFVEAAGPFYIAKLLRDGLGYAKGKGSSTVPKLDLSLDDRIQTAAGILKAMSLTSGFARLVLICGHGARVTNAPHASALQCGACGGHSGEVNARVLADLLNDADVRKGLASRGIDIPEDTLFLAGLHDTVSDEVRLFKDTPQSSHTQDMVKLTTILKRASALVLAERAATLPRGAAKTLPARGRDWSELRPEWGLAGCRGFIAAPRSRTVGRDFGGEVFLHDYSWRMDEGAATLELILSAPVVVASWIALQYHGSAIAPDAFGSGNKLLHNVVGGIGVLEGNGGALRAGLPWQSVHDGERLRHVPSRLAVMIEAPEEMILNVLDRQPQVRALFDNGWLSLLAVDSTSGMIRRYEKGVWVEQSPSADAFPVAA